MVSREPHLTVDRATQLMRAGDLDEAESVARAILRGNKRNGDAWQLLGALAVKRRDYPEALKLYRKCAAILPREGHYQFLVGKVLALEGRHDEALRKLDTALSLKPGYEPAAEWKATVLQWDGRGDEARALLEPFVAAGRENAGMAETQARLEIHDGNCRAAVEVARRHLDRPDLPPEVRHRLGHVAGDAYERLGEHDAAFAAHTDANRAVAVGFDRDEYRGSVGRVIEAFSRTRVEVLSRHGSRSELAVFIAGMPRCGTTLVEQIIDAHPLAHGAGEIRDIEETANGLPADLGSSRPYPECLADMQPDDVPRLARRGTDHLKRLGRGAKRVVNKSLENYRTLGLIATLFPAARIIHCRRDPRDTCLSCFTSGILPAAHPYVTDLADLGFAYRQYERLMAHWRQVIANPILEVRYEQLVDDLDTGSRAVIEFCGLEWDDRCLAFHASGRRVRTASYEQVRRPIYRSSIGRWQGYARHLGPLLAGLGDSLERFTS